MPTIIDIQTMEANGHNVKLATNVEIRKGYSPYIGTNGDWYVYDETVHGFVDTGVPASGLVSAMEIYVDGTSLVINTGLTNANEVNY